MRWWHILTLRLKTLVRGRRVDAELDEELRYHLNRQIDLLIASGETPERARQIAMLDMGGLEQRREECRDTRGVRFLSTARATLRDAVRALRRRPAAGLVTVITLAVGIGGGATMLAVVDVLMLRPPAGIVDPDRVVSVPASNYVVYSALREAATTLDIAAYVTPRALSLGMGAEAAEIRLGCVTPTYFDVLGTRVAIGRGFGQQDAALDTDLTLLLAHHFWQRYFSGDRDIVGRTVQIARRSYTIIGIVPPNVRGVDAEPVDGWIVLDASPAVCSFTGEDLRFSRGGSWLASVGRLRDDVTRDQAVAELEALLPTIDDGGRYERSGRPAVTLPTLRERATSQLAGDTRLSWWLLGGGLALLLTACANVAGLLAIRAIDRQREFAIRAQLGASRARVIAQVLTESVVLGAISGVSAIGIAFALDRGLRSFFPFAPDDGLLDGRFFAALGALTAVAGFVSGIAPALHAARVRAKTTGGLGTTLRGSRVRYALLVVQVAVALVLATGAGLFVESVANARTGLGYDADRVVVASVDFERAGYRRQAQIQEFFNRLVARAHDTPGVERVATARQAPLATSGSFSVRFVSTRTDVRPSGAIEDNINAVSAGYFTTVGTRILRGRDFLDSDDATAPLVMVVDEATAARKWEGEDALGRCAYIASDTRCFRVVGIVETRRHNLLTRQSSEFFMPGPQLELIDGPEAMPRHILLRLAAGSDAAVAALATALRSAAPDMPFVNVQRLDDLVDSRARTWRLGSALFMFFGTAAVGLAAIGLFATLSFVIRQRTPEIGVRLALGATHAHVTWLVARTALIVIVTGLAAGGVSAWFAARLIETSLFGVTPTDAGAFATAALTIAAVGAAASIAPCLRARRIDPIVALRTE